MIETTKTDSGERSTIPSERLSIGERGAYIPKAGGKMEARCRLLKIKCWLEKRKPKPMDDSERTLRQFIDLGARYELVYGLTFKGVDYDCGDMLRDLGAVVRGIAIVHGLA